MNTDKDKLVHVYPWSLSNARLRHISRKNPSRATARV
jgi:hypothetical protein